MFFLLLFVLPSDFRASIFMDVFILVYIIEVFQLTSPTHFYFTKAMKNLFDDQPEVNSLAALLLYNSFLGYSPFRDNAS